MGKFSVFVVLIIMGSNCHAQTDSIHTQKRLNDYRFMVGSGVILSAISTPILAVGIINLKKGIVNEQVGHLSQKQVDYKPRGIVMTSVASVTTAAGIVLMAIGAKGVYEIHHPKTKLDIGLLDDNTIGLHLSF